MSDRFAKIRELREKLCTGVHLERSASEIRKELLSVMVELKCVVDDDKSSVEDIRLKVADILSALSDTNGNKNE